jgi:hypothetical protein
MSEEESLIEAPVADTTTEQEVVTPTEDGGWKLANEISGEGDRPEWFKDKYNSVSDQAQAYSELEKRFGGFTGAPEESYELTTPEGVDGEFDMEDPRISWFQQVAKDSNMSQDTFTQMLHGWVQHEVDGVQGSREGEIQALGSNAQARLKDLGDWGGANLSPEEFEGFKMLASSAAGVQTLEALISKTRKGGVANTAAIATPGISKEALSERVSDPKYQTSADFRSETTRLFEEFYGE